MVFSPTVGGLLSMNCVVIELLEWLLICCVYWTLVGLSNYGPVFLLNGQNVKNNTIITWTLA